MEELSFQVLVLDPKSDRRVQNAVGFGDLVTDGPIYAKDQLETFFEDLILGRPFPLTFATTGLDTLSTLVAVCLFLHRDLAIHPTTPNLIAAVRLVDRHGYVGLAHVERDLGRLLSMLMESFPSNLGKVDQEMRLTSALAWIREYVRSGALPALPQEPALPRVLDRGTAGFVVAEIPSRVRFTEGWVELFRQGHLRGVLFGPTVGSVEGRRRVVVTKKSQFLGLDLVKAAEAFNEAERAMGEPPAWVVEDLWLFGPPEGTLLLPTMIVDVLVRM